MKQQYITVTGASQNDLDRLVNEKLAEGWELYGSPYSGISGGTFFASQAMVK